MTKPSTEPQGLELHLRSLVGGPKDEAELASDVADAELAIALAVWMGEDWCAERVIRGDGSSSFAALIDDLDLRSFVAAAQEELLNSGIIAHLGATAPVASFPARVSLAA
jgi:hypothetical protein